MLKAIQKEVENLRIKVYSGQSAEDTDTDLYEIEQMLFKAMDEQLILPIVSIALPSRKDYDERKLKPMYFKKDTSVGNSVLFIKGDEWQPYNWNYDRTIGYLKEGRLGYEC